MFGRLTKDAAGAVGAKVARERSAFYQRLAMALLQQTTWAIIERRKPGPGPL